MTATKIGFVRLLHGWSLRPRSRNMRTHRSSEENEHNRDNPNPAPMFERRQPPQIGGEIKRQHGHGVERSLAYRTGSFVIRRNGRYELKWFVTSHCRLVHLHVMIMVGTGNSMAAGFAITTLISESP
jgi:hypothetical protein